MNDVPNCKHEEGWYLCESPSDPVYWMRWCCAARCGHSVSHHPLTGLGYPRNPKPEKVIKFDYTKSKF